MSAINPASFVTPPGAGIPGGIGNPLHSQDTDRRHPHESRAYGGRDLDVGREGMPNMLRTAFTDTYQPFVQASRQTDQPDPFGPYSPGSYGPLETGLSDYNAAGAAANGAARMHPPQGEWVGRFQGLSLNS